MDYTDLTVFSLSDRWLAPAFRSSLSLFDLFCDAGLDLCEEKQAVPASDHLAGMPFGYIDVTCRASYQARDVFLYLYDCSSLFMVLYQVFS